MAMDALFSRASLFDLLEQRKQELAQEVETIPADRLLNAVEHDVCSALVRKYRVDIPNLLKDGIAAYDEGEADVDARLEPSRVIFDDSRPFCVKGHRITVVVPFEGDPDLFHYRPSSYRITLPKADVVGRELHLTFQGVQLSAEEVRRDIQDTVARIEEHLTTAREQVKPFNASLTGLAEDSVKRRKQRLLTQRGMVEALGIPIRPRAGAPPTYALPVKRRVPVIESVPATSNHYSPEPALASEEYERILNIAQNMGLVMERSPSAFDRVQEEHLRDHFLVQLNGQYEGAAAGEVFNYAGKTDILIRWEGRNVFIAECKFWAGPKKFHEAVDQLLSYASWRDTKTALFLFNRNRDLSRVLAQIPELLRQHPCWKRDVTQAEETRFRSIVRHPDDAAREVVVTVCVFAVPSADGADA